MEQQTCTLDGITCPLVRPAAVSDLTDLVRHAAADSLALFPVAGRTQLHLGQPPARPGLAVDLTALDGVIDFPARDMTVTVQAGVRIAALNRLLAAERLRLPVDVPLADRATLGGALAVNANGPRRFGFGTYRDYVLGLSAVNDQGEEARSGGRVVKNVAGYDLHKLHLGALGTLGIITQVTLKLRPVPEASVLLTLGCATVDLEDLLNLLHDTRTRPVCLDVLNTAAASEVASAADLVLPSADWVVVVGYEDSEAAVDWQVGQVMRELPANRVHGLEARAGTAAVSLWRALTDFPLAPALVTFKASLVPASVGSFCKRAGGLPGVRVQARAGSGIVHGHLTEPLTIEALQEMLQGLRSAASAARGSLILPRCPTAWKKTLPVWGPPGPTGPLAQRIKEQFDPHGLFNPGRM